MSLLNNIPKWLKRTLKILLSIILAFVIVIAIVYVLQRYVAHKDKPFTPKYDRVELTKSTDYKTIFLQTGLGKPAAERLIKENRFDEILKAQDLFFKNDEIECYPLMSWLTREDRLSNGLITFYDLQPGDILVTLSTHSFGWRHGHAAIVLNDLETVESIMLGCDSSKENIYYWQDYSNVALLRVKKKTEAERAAVADFSLNKLIGKQYSIFSGFGSKKAPDIDSNGLTLHCSYLAWYAWNSFGVDLDSDGGKLVTTYDILHSDKVEVVQLYGLNPNDFI